MSCSALSIGACLIHRPLQTRHVLKFFIGKRYVEFSFICSCSWTVFGRNASRALLSLFSLVISTYSHKQNKEPRVVFGVRLNPCSSIHFMLVPSDWLQCELESDMRGRLITWKKLLIKIYFDVFPSSHGHIKAEKWRKWCESIFTRWTPKGNESFIR